MRRTEQEFKAEVLRRSDAYRRDRAMKRRKIIGAGICVCLCMTVLAVFDPLGAKSEAPAANMMAMDEVKSEISMAQGTEFAPEYAMDGAAPMEIESAAEPEEAPRNEMVFGAEEETGAVADVSVSKFNNTNSRPLRTADALVVQSYLEAGEWIEGEPRCIMDCAVYVDGIVYAYSSSCGVFYDAERNVGLALEDTDRATLNGILNAYIPLESTGHQSVKVVCGNEEITLDETDSAIILGYLSSDGWIMSAANCLCDYTLHVNGLTYRYHSDCGTIQNEFGQSLTLPEAEREDFNSIVGKCPMRIE